MNRDEKAIRFWVRKTFPAILAAAAARGADVVFVDEAGFRLQPTVRRTYAPRGQTPVLKIAERISRTENVHSGRQLHRPRQPLVEVQPRLVPLRNLQRLHATHGKNGYVIHYRVLDKAILITLVWHGKEERR